jgi:hypothetical protein
MSVDVQWTDTCPDTGKKRFVVGERFAGAWTFRYRYARREDWMDLTEPDAGVFETLLEVLDRRQQRGDAVSEADLTSVRKRMAECQAKPRAEGELP